MRPPTPVPPPPDELYGTFDTARYTADHVPGARFVAYESGGHVWVGHHDEHLAEIEAFLRANVNAARSTTASPLPSP